MKKQKGGNTQFRCWVSGVYGFDLHGKPLHACPKEGGKKVATPNFGVGLAEFMVLICMVNHCMLARRRGEKRWQHPISVLG